MLPLDPTETVFERTGGQLTKVTETVNGQPRVTTFTRSGGNLTQTVQTYMGKTKTTTFNRDSSGVLTSTTMVET